MSDRLSNVMVKAGADQGYARLGGDAIVPGALNPPSLALPWARPLHASEIEVVGVKQVLHEASASPTRVHVLLSGWACRRRALMDGRQQILSLSLPGDCLMWDSGVASPSPAEVVALTPLRVIDAARHLSGAENGDAEIDLLRRRADFMQQALLLNHIVRLGRLSAKARLAHFLLELHDRLAFAGLVHDRSYSLPLNQETIGDFVGLSIVHVNRVLQELRRDGLIDQFAGKVTILARPALAAMAAYDGLPRLPAALS